MFNNDKYDVQTRSEENGLQYHETLEEAMREANKNFTIWKISFSHKNERVRLVRDHSNPHMWVYESVL